MLEDEINEAEKTDNKVQHYDLIKDTIKKKCEDIFCNIQTKFFGEECRISEFSDLKIKEGVTVRYFKMPKMGVF